MEYERALFRVYESCLEGLIPSTTENTLKSCFIIEQLILILSFIFLFILTFLHFSFNLTTGCLPQQLENYYSINSFNNFNNNSLNSNLLLFPIVNFTDDIILQITINSKFLPILDQNEVLRKRYLQFNFYSNDDNDNNQTITTLFQNNSNNSNIYINSTNSNNNNDDYSNNIRIPDYEFSKSLSVLRLPLDIREKHNFQIINITLGPECLGTVFQQNFIPFGGIDVIILNNVMSTFPTGGSLKSRDGKIVSWEDISTYHPKYFTAWLSLKISILFESIFAFFVLSTTTALLVRILISSGVVLLLPLFWIFQVIIS